MPDPSREALIRYHTAMRRPRIVYATAIVAVVAALAVVVSVAWSRGEIANTALRTATTAPPPLALRPASPHPELAWGSGDRAAIGAPLWGGTVVTFGAHSVVGRDARTGVSTWSYTRSDRSVCTAAQVQGVTIAIYRLAGNCDEVTALDSQTGTRRWTRTLDEDGMPVNGTPRYTVTPTTLMLTTQSVIYALDPASGIDRWTFQRPGCSITSAALGSSGALISQTCRTPPCASQKFCGPGPQLLLRDPTAPRNNDDKSNPDQIKWSHVGTTDLAASADQLISAINPASGRLDIFDAPNGRTRRSVSLVPTPTSLRDISAVSTGQIELLRVNRRNFALDTAGTRLLWTSATARPSLSHPVMPRTRRRICCP